MPSGCGRRGELISICGLFNPYLTGFLKRKSCSFACRIVFLTDLCWRQKFNEFCTVLCISTSSGSVLQFLSIRRVSV